MILGIDSMPLVFVHGVATRPSPEYHSVIAQRDAFFRSLVIGKDDAIYDPDWGSNAVKFAKGGWVPNKSAAEAWSMGSPPRAAGASLAAIVATKNQEAAIDLAIGALLADQAKAGTALSQDELELFEAAVRYLEGQIDDTAFSGAENDSQFVDTLEALLDLPAPAQQVEAMGIKALFSSMAKSLRDATDHLRNASSDVILGFIRKSLSNHVALFLGDVFVYLRWREQDGANGTYNRIFKPIIDDLVAANAARNPDRQLIVVGHSLGAVMLYDLLTDARALAEIAERSGAPLAVDALVSVGAQPGLFADMGLYAGAVDADGKLAQPACVRRWMNVYDYTDILSFRTEPFFANVKDFEFDNVSGALDAHSAYFQRPSFYKRLRARLSQP
jgi:hypothetical protein